MSTQQDNYRLTRAISNSLMGTYEDDFKAFVRYWVRGIPLPEKRDDSLMLGSAIDTLLTTPQEFNKRFTTYTGTPPKGQMVSYCHVLVSLGGNTPQNQELAWSTVGFKRDDITKVRDRFLTEGQEYYDYLMGAEGKIVLTVDIVDKATRVVEELTYGKYTRPFVAVKTNPEKRIDVYHQLELFSTYKHGDIELPIKGALDKVIINHEKKLITPIDYKSSYDVEGFKASYFKWRYYRQGSFYTYLVSKWARENGLNDYEIAPFRFIVCSTTGGKHYVYQMSEHDLEAAEMGGITKQGLYIKGWTEILEEIATLTKTDWEYPYEVIHNQGMIPLNIFQ